MFLAGDIKLAGFSDCTRPFALIKDLLQSEDVVYGNLEGALYDHIDPYEYYAKLGWRHPGTAGAAALREGNISVVGLANNVIIGDAAIRGTLDTLDKLGIAHTGAGLDMASARAPAIVERNGVRFGFLQRTSIFWPVYHRAVPSGPYRMPDKRYLHAYIRPGEEVRHFTGAPGVATIRPHTAYEPNYRSVYEAGGAAIIHTWPDADELNDYVDDIKRLRPQVDVLVTSNHWRATTGTIYHESEEELGRDFRVEVAHAAIDAGADIVASHGSHFMEEIEVYKGKAIFYGLGELFFGYSPDERGMTWPTKRSKVVRLLARAEIRSKAIAAVSCRLILSGSGDSSGGHSSSKQTRPESTTFRTPEEEPEAVEHLIKISEKFGTRLEVNKNDIAVRL